MRVPAWRPGRAWPGHFVWGQDQGPMNRNILEQEALLLQMLLAADAKHPGHQAAWDWVLARHGGSVGPAARACPLFK